MNVCTVFHHLASKMLWFVLCLIIFHTFHVEAIHTPVCPSVDARFPVYDAFHGNCSKFWQCSDGKPHLHDCPDGLHFNSVLKVCDWPERAKCAAARNNTNEEAGNNICLRQGIECPRVDGEHPVYGALPDCTKFCQCSNGKPYLHDCPLGLHFNPASKVCDWPANAGCAAVTNNTDEELGNKVCLQRGIECPRVDGEQPVYGALPDCTKFCQCSDGKLYLHNCPLGLHFNSASNVCDWPANAGCAAVTNDTDEELGNNICLQQGIECPRVDGKYPVFGALPDCTKFCQCSNGIPYLHDCPDGLHFDSVLKVCDWPERAGCTAVAV